MSTLSASAVGHYAGRIADDAGVVWLLYLGEECEGGMALTLTAVRADATHVRWGGRVWIIDLIVTSDAGIDHAAGRGSAFFARLREHFREAMQGDTIVLAPGAFHAPTTNTSEAFH
ncbi:MAG TPA: hypothetical protein PJ986_04605 [Gammaproteobacteria bacterium]|nr:hypothetical protein [Gammaproteobacteria bacterium]